VERRLQGDPRPPRRPPLRLNLIAAAVVAAILGGSALIGAIEVVPRVEDGISRDSALTPAQRRHAAGNRLGLDPRPFDVFRATLRARQRYAVDVPGGAKGLFITRGEVVRAYSAFYFLPAIQVRTADRVFRYRFR
jgi:hypothetical protein